MKYDQIGKLITLETQSDKLFVAYFLAGYLARAHQLRNLREPVTRAIWEREKAAKVTPDRPSRVSRIESGNFEMIENGMIKDVGLPVSKTAWFALIFLKRLQAMDVQLSADNWHFTGESSRLLKGLSKLLGQAPETWVNEIMEKLRNKIVETGMAAPANMKVICYESLPVLVPLWNALMQGLVKKRKLLSEAYLIGYDLVDNKFDRLFGRPEPSSAPKPPKVSLSESLSTGVWNWFSNIKENAHIVPPKEKEEEW